jgi:hypothetical protein
MAGYYSNIIIFIYYVLVTETIIVDIYISGTDILYGCHLLLDVCIIYVIILYNILKIAELDCCQIIILSIYVSSTHAYTHVLRLSLDLPYEKR